MEKELEQTTMTMKRKTRNLLQRVKDKCFLKSFDEVILLLHNTYLTAEDTNKSKPNTN